MGLNGADGIVKDVLGIPNMAPELHKQARPEGLEPPTLGLEVRRSLHLSYGRLGPSLEGGRVGWRTP